MKTLLPLAGRVARQALIGALAAISSSCAAWAQQQDAAPAEDNHLSLNGTWRFELAKTTAGVDALARFHEGIFDSSAFKPIPVPSNWAVLGYEEPVYRGFPDDKASEGFYLRDFMVPPDWGNRRVLLHFGGVWSSAEVWLNSKPLGIHNSGYTSFSFDVTGMLINGAMNRLAVRVRQVSLEYKSDTFDDWTLGGIYRDVSLEAMPKARWIDRVVAQTAFDDLFEDADLKLRVMVGDRHRGTLPGNYPSPGEPYDLRFTLKSKDGVAVAQRQVAIPAHTSTDRETRLTMRVPRPRHWTAETPDLYILDVELLEKGRVAQTRTTRIGFRQISTVGGVFRINGQAVKLRGINRHDEHPDVGRATTRAQWLQDITMMKAANINYIRLAHYTPAQGFIELCDELGMYLGNEVSLGGAGDLMHDPSFASGVLQRTYETVGRDINSPSIVYWSVGNEDPLTTLHLAAVQTLKGLDSTRPVLLPWRAEEWLPPEIDILAPHYWKPGEYDRLASRSTRPIISTEYTHAYGVDGFGGLEARWKALTRHPAGAGAAIWMWADQGIKTPTPKPSGGISADPYLRLSTDGWDGIVDSYRNPTRDYFETKAVYAPVYPAPEKVSFVPGQASVRIPIQNDYDFTNLSAVKINWTIYEDERELSNGSTTIEGEPHAASPLELPLTAVRTIRNDKTYYARFIFMHENANEITRKAVELVPLSPASTGLPSPTTKLTVTQTDSVTIQAGDARFVFSPTSGELTSATVNGVPLITGLRPVIWRRLDPSETSVIGRENVRHAPDLNKHTQSVATWDLREGIDRVTIRAQIKYTVDAQNSFAVNYDYSVEADGRLNVRYEIVTRVSVPTLPVVGMTIESAPELKQLRWLGLGPYDAFPNKQAAPILGVWGGAAGTPDVVGTKRMRWVERTGNAGGFRTLSDGYLEHDSSTPHSMRILTGVLSRPEKGRKADDSFPQLRSDAGEAFVGELSIVLHPRETGRLTD